MMDDDEDISSQLKRFVAKLLTHMNPKSNFHSSKTAVGDSTCSSSFAISNPSSKHKLEFEFYILWPAITNVILNINMRIP
jgi:hypothetical protein